MKRPLTFQQRRRLDGSAHEMLQQFNRAIRYADRGIQVLNDPHHTPAAQNNFSDADQLAAWHYSEARYCIDGALAEWYFIKKYFA